MQIINHRVGNHIVKREFASLIACFTIRIWHLSIDIQHHVQKFYATKYTDKLNMGPALFEEEKNTGSMVQI